MDMIYATGLEVLLPALIAGGTSLAAGAMQKTPKIETPTPLPKPDDAVRKQKMLEEQQRMAATKGRDSTNLTGNNPAPSYSNTALGS